MNPIISFLLAYNQFLLKQINYLVLFISKNISLKPKFKEPVSPSYQKLVVDQIPKIKVLEHQNYKDLLKDYLIANGKELKPVKPRGGKQVATDAVCPVCGAPHQYIYDNNGGRGQYLCKVCSFRFAKDKNDFKSMVLLCPHCGHALVKKKDRKSFFLHKCVNKQCSYYVNARRTLTVEEFDEYLKEPSKFKLHYIYREYAVDFFKLDLDSMPKGSVNLKFREFSPHIMGLCLTYLVNLGLSTRATSRAMLEIHGVKISHVTISKYAKSAAALVKPYVDSYDYKPSSYLASDETYIKVKGVRHYVWFVMDALKKSIIGYQISDSRDLQPCMLAMRMAFNKFKEFPRKALKFVSDGYSVYNLAHQQFVSNNMDFNLIQVIGLTNEDAVSTEYRWLKQIIERLNRTFKFSYQVTNGYGSYDGSNTHLALFVAYYNFLRPHPYTYWGPLNAIHELETLPNMPAKWQKLIELSQKYILANQSA